MLRDDPSPGRGRFRVPAAFPLDHSACTKLMSAAHGRGFFVYGLVSCGVRSEKRDAVLDQFRALHELGVDGLYISFDDPGGGGPEALVPRIVQFAKELGYAGDQAAFLSGGGNYTRADTPWNRRMAALPGLDELRWVLTAVPPKAQAEAAERIGLRGPIDWWHNWPIAALGGLAMPGPYSPLLKLKHGWRRPTYEALEDAHKHVDHAMVWVRQVDEYWGRAFGLWAWAPETHDSSATERTVYSRVFGTSLVEPARRIDARLQELVSLSRRYGPGDWNMWVIHLANAGDRPKARAMVNEMAAALAVLEQRAPGEPSLTQERLLGRYLALTRKTLRLAKAMLQLELPDYTISRSTPQEQMLKLIKEGKEAEARRRLEQVDATVRPMLAEIAEKLSGSSQSSKYVSEWERLLDHDHWVRRAAK